MYLIYKKKFIIIFICFIVVVYLIIKLTSPSKAAFQNIVFKGKINKIYKAGKGSYNIEIELNKKQIISINDSKFNEIFEKIKIGDSLIKESNSSCFYYKKDRVIIYENCNSIYIDPTSRDILGLDW